jgi:hypothetical protein
MGISKTDEMFRILDDLITEVESSTAMHGDQRLCDGTDSIYSMSRDRAQARCQYQTKNGGLTWASIIQEEFFEAMAETNWPELRAELIQVMAVAFKWIQDGDTRHE